MIRPPPAPRSRSRGKRRASPPPAEPSPFGNPHPGTPLQIRNSQRGRALSAQNVVSAVGGRVLRGADPPRALRVTALANLCPCFAPVCPQGGRPEARDEKREAQPTTKNEWYRLHASASLQRQAIYSSVTRRARGAHVARPRTRPPPRVRDCSAPVDHSFAISGKLAPSLCYAVTPALPSALTGLPGI
jgi:hypothetical protein